VLSNAISNDSSLGVGTSRLDAETLVTLLDDLTNVRLLHPIPA
jgi:hypothetical protein